MTARVILDWIVVVVLCAAAAAATQKTAGAETYAVRVVRDVPYLEGGRYADGKDKLDIYLPEGRRNTAVIVSYYGNQLMGGDKSEDAYIVRRFAAAGFVSRLVVNRPAVSRGTQPVAARHPRYGSGQRVLLGRAPGRRAGPRPPNNPQ